MAEHVMLSEAKRLPGIAGGFLAALGMTPSSVFRSGWCLVDSRILLLSLPVLGPVFLVALLSGWVMDAHAQARPAPQPAASQTTRPVTQPATQPATRPATQPTTQPQTQPAPKRKPLTPQALYGPEGKISFDASYARGMVWLDDGRHYRHRRDGRLVRIDALTDAAEPAYDEEALQAALRAHDDFDEKAAKRLARRPTQWSTDRSAVLVRHKDRLYVYRFADARLKRLTDKAQSRRVVQISPHGNGVGFVRDNDLYAIDAHTGRQRRLTRDGSGTVLNGILDWVYQEEIYGRGRWRAYWWRDDARYLAYLRLDESNVPLYTIVDYIPHVSETSRTRYPKAGDPNPTVRLGIARVKTRRTVWVDLTKYDGIDILIVGVSWAPDGRPLFSVQDREQRWLELNAADPRTGRMRTLIREASPAWVNDSGSPHWLDDGSFLWRSERDGYRHIYHYSRDGELLRRVTRGDWPVRSIIGYDAESGAVYFTGSRETVFETHAYRVPLRGGPIERLTEPGYSHRVNFDPTFRLFFDTFSNVSTPTKVYLRRTDGSLVRVVSDNEVEALDEYVWTVPELLRIPNRNGFMMNLRMFRPPGFDLAAKYPLLCNAYGAPGAHGVCNEWLGSGQLRAQYFTQQGYIVCRIDPHQASGEGAIAAWQGYRRLGQSELADIEDALHWLIDQGYVDPGRIGITGYSYGGFFAAYALTHSDMFRMGIAGALLSDWRNYDSVYTERYMQTPQNNPDGYDRAAVSNAARDLHGRLLIVHGLQDDNVHFQNTAQLIDRLQEHRQMFDLMVYPRDRHGLRRGGDHFHWLCLDYIRENL
jgi:dipeptidyl-peptidase-4